VVSRSINAGLCGSRIASAGSVCEAGCNCAGGGPLTHVWCGVSGVCQERFFCLHRPCQPTLPALSRRRLAQNLDRLLRTHATDHFRKLEALLAALPPRCLLFGAYCSRALSRSEAKKEGGGPNLSRLFGSLGGGDTGMGGGGGGGGGSEDMTILDRLGKGAGRGPRKSVKGKALSKMLPNLMELHPPNQDCYVSAVSTQSNRHCPCCCGAVLLQRCCVWQLAAGPERCVVGTRQLCPLCMAKFYSVTLYSGFPVSVFLTDVCSSDPSRAAPRTICLTSPCYACLWA
jgi:hypothetical protein